MPEFSPLELFLLFPTSKAFGIQHPNFGDKVAVQRYIRVTIASDLYGIEPIEALYPRLQLILFYCLFVYI